MKDLLAEIRRQNDLRAAAAAQQAEQLAPGRQAPRRRKPPRRAAKGQQAPETEPIVTGQVPRVAPANAASIGSWARPATLRSQFVLTEILKPPLSMREPE